MRKSKEIPIFKTPLFETHCHLDYLKGENLSSFLSKCEEVNIASMMTIGVSPDNQKNILSLVQKSPKIYGSLGIHPHEAKNVTPDLMAFIKDSCKNEERILAIGETGLDYYYDHSPREIQRRIFEEHINLALELNLPIIIHSRDADEDTMAILKNFSSKITSKAVIHSFTSGRALAELALDLNLFLGFNGILTFKTAENVRDVLKMCPIGNILLETDSPFLTPTPFRGKENFAYYLPFVAQEASKILELETEDFLQSVYQNSMNFFQLNSLSS